MSPFSSRGSRKFKDVARGCTAQKGQSWDADPGLLVPQPCVLPTASGGGAGRGSVRPRLPSPHLCTCPVELVRLGPSPAPHGSPSPTDPPHFPSLHSKAWLPSPCVLRPQGRVLRLQHGQLVGSKALSTTGKALMTLPTAKVLMSFPPHPDLKLAPSMLKPGQVGLELGLTPWRVVLSSGIGAEGHRQRASPRQYSAPGKGLSCPEPCSKTEA